MASPQQVTDQQIAQWNQQLAQDPEFRRLLASFSQGYDAALRGRTQQERDALAQQAQAPLRQYLQQRYGIDPSQQGMILGSNGQLTRDHTNRDAALIIGGLVAGGYGASVLAGPAGATAAGSAAAPAAAASSVPAAAATAGGGLGAWLPTIIGGGSAGVGSYLDYRAQSKATDAQTKAADDALALQREAFEKQLQLDEINRKQEYDRYTQNRKDLEPYRGLGAGAVGNLAYLGGINMPPPETPIPFTPGPGSLGNPTQGAAPATTAVPQQPTGIAMRTPNGRTVQIPENQVQEALRRGAQRI